MTAETRAFQAEIRKLLDILVHSLYTEREIFLRELISNASDALHRVQFEMLTNHEVRDPGIELSIHVRADSAARTLTIADTGIGMTREELVENLGTIARSGAEAFARMLQEGASVDQIGRFGVGFYSVFMVAEEVSVTSLSYRPDASAWTWRARGEDSYELEPAERDQRGTTIVVRLNEDAGEFAEPGRLESIIHRHSDFVSFPIYVGDSATPANHRQALWRQPASEVTAEAAADYYRQLTLDWEKPLLHITVSTDAPVQVHALLFIPSKLDRSGLALRQDFGLRLYSHRVRIQEHNKDLLPPYLRFVEGVVDSDDLSLNVSRETVQASPVMRRIKSVLTRRVLDGLKDLAAGDAEKYAAFWGEFAPFIKEGIATEAGDKDRLVPLLRFYTSRNDAALSSLYDYVGRVAPDQRALYFLPADDQKGAQRSPHLDYFRKKNLEVLFFLDPLDGLLPSALEEFEGFPFRNVAEAGLELPADETAEAAPVAPAASLDGLLAQLRTQLGERVQDVRLSSLLSDHPARLVAPAGAIGSEMERMRRLMDRDYEAPARLLEINPHHPLILNLAQRAAAPDDIFAAAAEQLYDNCLLLEGFHPNPADMVDRIARLMEAATRATGA